MVKKTEWQRVKLTARKLVQQLVKEKEKVDTTTEVQQSPTRNSAEETTFGTDPTEETTNLRGEKIADEGGEKDDVVPDYLDLPDWLREGLEGPKDYDIFAGLNGQESTQASINSGSINFVRVGSEQQQENQQAKARKQVGIDQQQENQQA